MKIEHLHVRNFRVFRDITLADIPSFAVFVGANGTGKSTLFDVFGFLRDALQSNVHTALAKRGGFREVVSRQELGPIVFEIKFRDRADGPLVTYRLEVGELNGRGAVRREVLKYRRGQHGQPWKFIDFKDGQGEAVTNEVDYGTADAEMQREVQTLDSPEILAIKGLGQFQRFETVANFRRLIESWHLSDFHIGAARPSQDAGYAEHLSAHGDNLSLVTQFLFENHRDRFDAILERMRTRVPGVDKVEATETVDGRLVLRFQDGAFRDPFISRYVSDGTIKMFAYLVLLHDPSPHPLLCVEEPENQLYPTLLAELAEEFRSYGHRGGQVLVSTHSPDLLNAVELDEIFWLTKVDGFTAVKRANHVELLRELVSEGDPPGALWKQGLFDGVDP